MSGAAPLSGELMQTVVKIFPNACIGQGYGKGYVAQIVLVNNTSALGMTETSTTITMMPPTQKIGTVGSAGKLIPGIRARVVKPDGSLAKEGEPGELVVTGPSMALYYLNNEAA